jgi:hypothetical protein
LSEVARTEANIDSGKDGTMPFQHPQAVVDESRSAFVWRWLLVPEPPHGLAPLYVISLSLLFIFVAVQTPMIILAHAPHDDGLFIAMGKFLSEGKWLGPFNQFTLMKGPGYPAFLALSDWLGLPISLSQALFHVVAVVCFTIVAHRWLKSALLSGLLFTLLLWHPVSASLPLLRVLRDRIYYDLLILLLAALVCSLFSRESLRSRHFCSGAAGILIGWFWLTREEGVWILPGLLVIVSAAALHAYRDQQVRQLVGVLSTIALVFAATQIGFRAVNWWVYDKFVGVDFKEVNFQRALGALSNVRSGGAKPFVTITHEAMLRVAEVSPTFESIAPQINSKEGDGFACPYYPGACDEIGAGWFMWKLRDVAANAGHFSSPAKASAFFEKLAHEVEGACQSKALSCGRPLIAEMPMFTWQSIGESLQRYLDPALRVLFMIEPDQHAEGAPTQSTGDEPAIKQALHFLHYPKHLRSMDWPQGSIEYFFRGWFYKAGDEWMYGRGSHEKLTDSGDWRETLVLTQHRYMLEDTRMGLSFLASVAALADVPTPLVLAFLAIGSAICGEDFMRTGRTLETLGLGHLDRAGLKQFLLEGF